MNLRLSPGCHCCGGVPGYYVCANCSRAGNNMPQYMTVEISGMANDNCSSCADFDATYVVTYPGGGTYCAQSWSDSPSPCGGHTYSVGVSIVYASSEYHIYVTLSDDCTGTALYNNYFWDINLGASKPDCLTFDEVSVTGGSASGAGTCSGVLCDPTGATVKVSSGDTT
jgi:hypothetical protein